MPAPWSARKSRDSKSLSGCTMLASGAVSASAGRSTPAAGWNACWVVDRAVVSASPHKGRLQPEAARSQCCAHPATHLPELDQRLRAVSLQEVQLPSVDADHAQEQLAGEAQRQGHLLVVERLVDDGVCTGAGGVASEGHCYTAHAGAACTHRRSPPGPSPQSGSCAACWRSRCGRQSRWCPAAPAWPG